MDKTESANNQEIIAPAESKIADLSHRVFGVIKFLLGLCFLPLVYSVAVAFLDELSLTEKWSQDYFWAGIITLVIIHLFIWEPAYIYAKGHKIIELLFSFFKPLVKVAPYLLPIYTILLFAVYGLMNMAVPNSEWLRYFVFLFGFSIGLHLIFGAKTLRTKKNDFLKSNYIFGFSFVFIVDVFLLSFGLSLIFEKFSFVNFSNNSYQISRAIFAAVFKQLFLR